MSAERPEQACRGMRLVPPAPAFLKRVFTARELAKMLACIGVARTDVRGNEPGKEILLTG